MTVHVACYGTGANAQPYLHALARRPDVALVAVCDPDRLAAEQTASGRGTEVFLSYEAMLDELRPDALWICVPPQLQGDVILKAVELRIPFFVTPPGAPDYERACLYAEKIHAAGLVTTVGFCSHFADVVLEAREYLGANPVPLAAGWWLRHVGDNSECSAQQLLWSDACRWVDALRLFCGEVERVRALPAREGTAGSGLVIQLEFDSGTAGVLTCATYARAEPRLELELMGPGWSLQFGADLLMLRLAERDKITILRCLNEPAADHVEAFLTAVVAGKQDAVSCEYADALRTLAVCNAAERSAREARPISLTKL
jgi:predicted dehydrogenase